MLSFLVRHSLPVMFLFALLGFVFPSLSLAVFPYLPLVLFSLMTLTLLGMKQSELLKRLSQVRVWRYAALHAFLFMGLATLLGWVFSLTADLLLAILAVAATGSLFATPAIVKALGFDNIEAMAMTIATTLLLPVTVSVALLSAPLNDLGLDWASYFARLVIFIFGPMVFSFLVHAYCPTERLNRVLLKISPYTILLVFAFPLGLVGSFRLMFDADPMMALRYFIIAVVLCMVFFVTTFMVFRKQGVEIALTAAITSGNRNVLLTYSVAGVLLGPAFLPLAGALQIPTYLLPVVTRWLHKNLLQ
ncbi:hypothetical protein [Marinomonas aquiplantarum]|uniref:BASS family bile acid:Na+ symporter n=1 Tax=Marinomonas aquiplantarum TaxID=491951 RepID=A0A366CSP1_9GAMM|nr:hypothetical protein [Marinomonas aquiplantarum]RBO78389.1 BASS family bile acid:Na+ symporter [Marinomonas aquiplantarum]